MNKSVILSLVLSSLLFASSSVHAQKTEMGKKLYLAAQSQDAMEVESLLKKGADANHFEIGRPILGWAAQNGNVQIVELLLKGGADPNLVDTGVGHTPLMRAIETQFIEIVRALLKAKADPNAKDPDGKTCLIMAVSTGKTEFVQALVDAGVDVKYVSSEGDSPILAAAQEGSSAGLEMIRILAKAGAEMNASNAAYSPLVYAIQQGNVELTKTLLDAGADANARTTSGTVPLESALDNAEILDMLLKAKADPETRLESGDSILIAAIRGSQMAAVKRLLDAGADPTKPDQYGTKPLEIAQNNYQTEIIDLIKEKLPKDPVVAAKEEPGAAESLKRYPVGDAGDGTCTIAVAARRQMELHGKLQAQVDAGKMSSEIFRTFGDDTKDYGNMLVNNPTEACRLFDRLGKKYGVE